MKSFSYTDFFYRSTLYLALAVALTATLGSLYFSEVRGYLPCNLCWYQRILMYPLVVVLAVGLLRQDINLPYYVLPLSLFGQGIATYHYLLEKTNIFAAPTTCQEGIPCTTPWINWMGFITIPFLAMSAFFLITVLCLIAMTSGEPAAEENSSPPWFQVATVIVVVAVAFVLIYQFDPLRRASTLTLTTPVTGEMTPVTAVSSAVNSTVASAVASSAAITTSAALTDTARATGAVDEGAGAQLYGEVCAACHGAEAQGVPNLGTSLAESAIIHGQSEADALAFIRAGRAADDPANTTGIIMPPSGGRPDLSDDQILAIISYLHTQ
ncbi:MAG: disulfide bond formation protein B [Caldilineaceae bacterium]|nr:disulfide bond formation protein B [Caldilineaceae bacterium]